MGAIQQWLQQEQESEGLNSSIIVNDGSQEPLDTRGSGAPQSRVGRDSDGFSPRLDRYRWPAGYGQPQDEWEPPRAVTERIPNHAKRLKALGNAVVPQIAEYIGKLIMEREYDQS